MSRTRLGLCGAAVVAALAAAYGLAQRYGVDPHGQAGKCRACHLDPPREGLEPPAAGQPARSGATYPLRYDRERAVCERCHIEHNAQTHPVETVPRLPVPPELPLDAQRRLTCSTCHDPHRARSPARPAQPRFLLRGTKEGPLFCQHCHGQVAKGDRRAWHAVAVQSAHHLPTSPPAAAAPGAPWGSLDPLSVRCLACHDGTMGRDVGVRMRDARLGVGRRSSHPVGIVYPTGVERAAKDGGGPRLRPPALLDKRIRLFDGKIGCGTCHDPYAQNSKLLVMDPARGDVCRTCHDI